MCISYLSFLLNHFYIYKTTIAFLVITFFFLSWQVQFSRISCNNSLLLLDAVINGISLEARRVARVLEGEVLCK